MKLRNATTLINKRAKQLIEEGRVPVILGTEGLLALMFNDIMQAKETNDPDWILDLASHALIAFNLVAPEIPEPQEETTLSKEDIDELIDAEDMDEAEKERWTPVNGSNES